VKIDQTTRSEQRPSDAPVPGPNTGYRNQIRESLRAGTFLYTLEYVPDLIESGPAGVTELKRNSELVGRDPRIGGINIGDRVKSLDSLDTVTCGRIAADAEPHPRSGTRRHRPRAVSRTGEHASPDRRWHHGKAS
jgi:hypothetical protein